MFYISKYVQLPFLNTFKIFFFYHVFSVTLLLVDNFCCLLVVQAVLQGRLHLPMDFFFFNCAGYLAVHHAWVLGCLAIIAYYVA